ncbi:hypothetical protein D3C81_1890650 [compost metagenome]
MNGYGKPGINLPGQLHLMMNLSNLSADSGNRSVNRLERCKGFRDLVILLLEAFFRLQHEALKVGHTVLKLMNDLADMYGGIFGLDR